MYINFFLEFAYDRTFKIEVLCGTVTKFINLFVLNYFEVNLELKISFLSETLEDEAYTQNI